ncbi:hypothetical protein ASF84_09635 [Pseudomonas sp. Leaf127]|uniref:DUF6393 family protein n=1 Tax=Pseudomonas sp. Leaf127 TaxID=1736267 RepID=UPI000702874A|nr:DUF6393 family protein [Pseudomonas sp. Leaf127]KQQ55594.1 hypothetical protein ASF84_09635 [Pseudomonas sp. Leaf127]
MKSPAVAIFLLAFMSQPALARPMDCARASAAIEHLICADSRLVTADAAMASAYASILRRTDDPEIRSVLLASQRRWMAARDQNFEALRDGIDPRTGEPYTPQARSHIVLKAIEARTRQLGRIADQASARPELIQRAIDQRAFDAGFTGGRFAGSSVACEFVPQADAYAYGCFGTRFHQNNNRICSVSQDWASGDLYQTRAVAEVIDGKPKLIATCRPGIQDCAEGSPGWSTRSGDPDADTQRLYDQVDKTPLARLDVELDDPQEFDDPWLTQCLTAPGFPWGLSVDLNAMFDEVYASKKPVGFEQVDVSSVITRYFPLNTRKAALTRAFTPSRTWTIVEDLPDRLVIRDNRGRAIVDPDASSVVMTFAFNKDSLLSQVHAVRVKSQ